MKFEMTISFYEQEIVHGEMPVNNHSSEEFSDPELIQGVCM